jgi:2-polyprenyl-3-methyl-5-hydroxy-6-metoxy-1,4-benzoquinol methylase
MPDLQTIRQGWDHAAREDAMFNIITHADRANGGWTPGEFFAHGQAEIDSAIERLIGLDLEGERGRALDFGCGIGRLTQALANRYDRVDGVDISPEMIALADEHNLHGERCVYHTNLTEDLSLFEDGSFDLVYTMIVLQHMPQPLQRGYVTEFFRVLRPGGVAMFEMPDGPDYQHPNEWLSMYGVPRATVEEWVAEDGARLVDVELIPEPSVWDCLRYTAVKS